MKIKATKDPRKVVSALLCVFTVIWVFWVVWDLVHQSPVAAAVDAAIAVLFFFYWRAERAQLKVDRREREIAAEAIRFAHHQSDDIPHGVARRQMAEFIRTQRAESEAKIQGEEE